MKTLTDIKKALKLCVDSYDLCKLCPYYVKNIERCTHKLTKDIIKIINEYERLKMKNKYKLKAVLKDIKLCLHGDCDGCYFQRKGKPNCVDGLYNELVKVIDENNK